MNLPDDNYARGLWKDPVGWGGQYGYYLDRDAGYYLLGHRYYDPYRGRFLTRDPLGYAAGPNLYTFCGGDPINQSDPDGTISGRYAAPDSCGTGILPANYAQFKARNQRISFNVQRYFYNAWLHRNDPHKGPLECAAPMPPIFGIEGAGAEAVGAESSAARVGVIKWEVNAARAEKVMTHSRFGKFFKIKGSNEWWSRDTAGHGGSAYKVFRQEGRNLKWIEDADEDGNFIRGKHKGPTGLIIPLSDFGN